MKNYEQNRIYKKCVKILAENVTMMTNLKDFDLLTFDIVKDVLYEINPSKSI